MADDFLRIYVISADGSDEGDRLAELVSGHFDGLGMEREGVAIRVPVRLRSKAWEPGGVAPRPIDLADARHNAVVLLHDGYMHEDAAEWDAYVAELRRAMAARGGIDAFIPFGSPTGEPPLPSDASRTQYVRRERWSALPDERSCDARFLLHLVFAVRHHLASLHGGLAAEPLFVSHAKADGDGSARAILDYLNRTDQDVPLKAFYDAKELVPGEDFEQRFVTEIERGTLLAIVSDIYDSRPWCIFELTTAKRARRPIVLADIGRVRTSRTYPYGANLPRIRVDPDPADTGWIELLLVHTLSEGLRCDIFEAQVERAAAAAQLDNVLILPRPPELFDVVDREVCGRLLVYPDPPLGRLEAELLAKAVRAMGGDIRLMTFSELAAA